MKLNETSNKLEECQGELAECEVKMKKQEREVERLASLLDVTTTKLSAAEEEKKLMSEDLERKYENEDEQIRRDMNIRNEAVKEKNMAWIELSQTKVCWEKIFLLKFDCFRCLQSVSRKGELLQTNHQLMEVIQQKVNKVQL